MGGYRHQLVNIARMNRLLIFLLISSFFSCQKNTSLKVEKRQFQNKTFSLFNESEKDTLIIEFQDSTHQTYGNIWQGKLPWRISKYNKTDFLVLDNKAIGIKKTNEDTYICTYIGLSDNIFNMVERKSKWKQESIYGIWVNKKNEKQFDYSPNDSIKKPPLPPSHEGFSESDYQWPPFYEITEDSIKFHMYYSIAKSALEINNTKEYLLMKLDKKFEKNWEWNIKSLSKDKMIIEKKITKWSTSKFETDTLIRKNINNTT